MRISIVLAIALTAVLHQARGASEFRIDFAAQGGQWSGNKDIAELHHGADGLALRCTGGADPWIVAKRPYEIGKKGEKSALCRISLETAPMDSRGSWTLYYAPLGKVMNEERTVELHPAAGEGATTRLEGIAHDAEIWGNRVSLRLDPPGSLGSATLKTFAAEPMEPLLEPKFATPPRLVLPANALKLGGGEWRLLHDPARWNAWAVDVAGKRMAESNPEEKWVALGKDGKPFEMDWSKARIEYHTEGDGLTIRAVLALDGGGAARLTRTFQRKGRALGIATQYDGECPLVSAPWLTVLAARDSAGRKTQALMPGVEYLEDEPSSSEKEIRGAQANRIMPASFRLCYPLMAVVEGGRFAAVTWKWSNSAGRSPIFDTPDRTFNSGGHLMGLWSPAIGDGREESLLTVYSAPRNPVRSCEALLWFGRGSDVTAVLDATGYSERAESIGNPYSQAAVELLSHGWLDSAARVGTQWRHAVMPGAFGPMSAPDVQAYLLWLASATTNGALAARLEKTAAECAPKLEKDATWEGCISHIEDPVGVLFNGGITNFVRYAAPFVRDAAHEIPKGGRIYRPAPGGPDYASTLGTNQCNGYTAIAVERVLRRATWTGDETAIRTARRLLDAMIERYPAGVPRGAQPWEMPLHTPDIVAAGRLCRCCTYGYLLSGAPKYLESARYWAKTGLTMVYLDSACGPIGPFATTGVIGATGWVAPNWIGRPVQWCGLVYSSALAHLAMLETDQKQRAFWAIVACNIDYAGLQMTCPLDDRENCGGLLPDSFGPAGQVRYGPMINPGTLEANIAEVSDRPFYTANRLQRGSVLHTPGSLVSADERGSRLAIKAWPTVPYWIVCTRMQMPKGVSLKGADGGETPLPYYYVREARTLIVQMPPGNNKPQEIGIAK